MKTLKINRDWRSPTGMMKPGEYRIPGDISMTHAKCARADGAGEIVEAANFRRRGRPPKKQPAPENKIGAPASENKADMDGADGHSGGERTELEPGASRNGAPDRPANGSG